METSAFYARPLAQKFRQTLEQAIQQARMKASPAFPEPSLSLEERLTRLHDDKLISDAEFEQKRQAILNEL